MKIVNKVSLIVIMLLFSALTALAAPPDNFTCKITLGSISMNMAKMGNKSRVDNVMFEGLVTITQRDLKKSITMNTKNKTYFEQTTQERIPSIYDPNTVIERKKIGTETIDGHPCIKYNATFYSKDKPQEKYTSVLWEAQDLGGLPIKNQVTIPPDKRREGGPDKFTTEMKEIKVGSAKASMFEVPKDYKRVASMSEVMGGDIRQMMQQRQKK
jgi:hypothetical protein